MNKFLISAIAFAGVFSAGSALAESANLNIEAKIIDSCSLSFETPTIHFLIGRNDFKGAEQVSHFTAKCGDTALNVALDGGSAINKDDGVRAMKMTGGLTGTIPYLVYQGTDSDKPWDDKDNIYKISAADSEAGTPQAFRVIIPQASVTPSTPEGDYADKLIATLSYDAAAS